MTNEANGTDETPANTPSELLVMALRHFPAIDIEVRAIRALGQSIRFCSNPQMAGKDFDAMLVKCNALVAYMEPISSAAVTWLNDEAMKQSAEACANTVMH